MTRTELRAAHWTVVTWPFAVAALTPPSAERAFPFSTTTPSGGIVPEATLCGGSAPTVQEPFMPCSGAPLLAVTWYRLSRVALQPNLRLTVRIFITVVTGVFITRVAESF